MPLPPKFFSVTSYDLKSMPFKFGKDIFIIFEMPGSSDSRPVGKVNISMLFRPSVIRGPWIVHGVQWTRPFESDIKSLPAFLIASLFSKKIKGVGSENEKLNGAQRPRIGLNKRFLPKPNTTTA